MATEQEEYKVQLDVFEGPLDLLLYLIKKDELDIHDIPIEHITTQYMKYLDLMRMLDLSIAGEFIVMAATLMLIKSRMLLPVEERKEIEGEDEEDPRWELVKQLVEYKKFKDAAIHLHVLEIEQENVFARETAEGVQLGAEPAVSLQDVSIFDLISAFNQALGRVKEETLTEIFSDRYTVAEKVDQIINLIETKDRVSLKDVFSNMSTKAEIICTFLAVLELMKLRHINAKQDSQFNEITIVKAEEP